MTTREALQAIYEERGALTPAMVLAEAEAGETDAGRALYDRFEWDEQVAAAAHRLEQARDLIRSVKVRYREATEDEQARFVRQYVSVRRPEGQAYLKVEDVAEDPLIARIVLRDAEREWKALLRRYRHLDEFIALVRGDVEGERAMG